MTFGTTTRRVAGEVPVERLRIARLVAVVELEPDRPRELVDELPWIDELERLHALAQEPCRLVEQAEVGFDLRRSGRALHLHRDFLTVGKDRAMHLPDRGRGHRNDVELEKRALDRQVELGFDHIPDLVERRPG